MPNAATKKTALARKVLQTHLALAVGLLLMGTIVSMLLPQPVAEVTLRGRTYSVVVAANAAIRERGLSDIRTFASGTGMLFVFGHDDIWRFWMKDMHYGLDIVWLNAKKEVVHVAHNATPASYPHVFTPPQESRYVLEVPAGDASEVVPGDIATF
jgi:uncharacterized membrane protein (UPF0127 family)